MKTYLYRASHLKSTITFLALVFHAKNRRFLRFIHNNNNKNNNNNHFHHHHQLLQTVFLRVYRSGRYITYTIGDHSSRDFCFYHWF